VAAGHKLKRGKGVVFQGRGKYKEIVKVYRRKNEPDR
jgi:hypothetical protein